MSAASPRPDPPPLAATTRPPEQTPPKRGQGRPAVGGNEVGQERLLAATEKLLRELPPARVTIARIAQEASVDPALVRYYFVPSNTNMETLATSFQEFLVKIVMDGLRKT